MRSIFLVALVGLPAAGKSSLCTWLLSQHAALCVRQIVHLCFDDFLDVGPSAELAYKKQRERVFTLIEQLVSAIQKDTDWPPQIQRIASSGKNSNRYLILCDDNFYYRSMRYQLHQLCRRTGCVFGQIHLAKRLDSCLRANSERSDSIRVPEAVVRQMNERLEPPGAETWERNSLTLHDVDAASTCVLSFIGSLLEMPTEEKLELSTALNGQPQDQSLAHSLDLLLRTRIRALLQRLPQAKDKGLAGKTLNDRRKQILIRFRTEGVGKQKDGYGGGEALDYYVNLLN